MLACFLERRQKRRNEAHAEHVAQFFSTSPFDPDFVHRDGFGGLARMLSACALCACLFADKTSERAPWSTADVPTDPRRTRPPPRRRGDASRLRGAQEVREGGDSGRFAEAVCPAAGVFDCAGQPSMSVGADAGNRIRAARRSGGCARTSNFAPAAAFSPSGAAQSFGDLEQWFDAVQRVSQAAARDLDIAQDVIREVADQA